MTTRIWLICAIPLCVAGCVNPTTSGLRDTRVLPAYSAPPPLQKPVPPQKDPEAYRSHDSGRTYSLTIKNADLRDVLMLLSRDSGVSIVAERGVHGIVQVNARNKKLGELLYTILKPLGYTASVENGSILVGRPKLTTRTFRVNYLKDKRNSTSNMNVSGFTAGSVSVSTEGKSDFWGALEGSLEIMVFGTTGMGRRESGGYLRGETERKLAAESKTAATTQTNRNSTLQGNYTGNGGYAENDPAILRPAEMDDQAVLQAQLSRNQLKQLVVNEIAGIIQVTDYPENLDRISSFLADVEEGSKRQVLIQAHIMEVSLKDSFSLGIDWKYIIDQASHLTVAQALVPVSGAAGTTVGSNVFKLSASGDNFNVLLDAMKEQGNVNMLSSPKITALNNQKAVIKLTTKQVSWVSTKTTQNNAIGGQDTFTTIPQVDEVGIFLDVTPQIGQDNSVSMQIHPSVSEITEISTSPDKTSTKPVIDIREIDTMVDAKAGETIVIAGLISDKLNETKRSVPFLGDIPYLGTLFSYNSQNRNKVELVIMMTPYILNAKSIEEIRKEHELRMQNIGGNFHLINNLGSMVTEKKGRDWIKNSQPDLFDFPANEDNNRSPAPLEVQPPSATGGQQSAWPVPLSAAPEKPQAPRPEAKKPVEPVQIIEVTPTESILRMQQQQAEIEQLKNEVTQARERLAQEREESEKRAAQAAADVRMLKATGVAAEDDKPAVTAKAEPVKITAPQPVTASLQTAAVTSSREQTLFNSAVRAYRMGDCKESVKTFDTYLKQFPNSPFSQDARHYRDDCSVRLAITGQ